MTSEGLTGVEVGGTARPQHADVPGQGIKPEPGPATRATAVTTLDVNLLSHKGTPRWPDFESQFNHLPAGTT